MRQLTAIELDRVELLTRNSVEFTLIEPTRTGLLKSIMDATGTVRNYLKERNLHDYSVQKQGQGSKIYINSYLVEKDKIINSIASLYRPDSKQGDPRIWFRSAGNYTEANNILALIEYSGELYVVDITRIDLATLLNSLSNNPIQDLIRQINTESNFVANELLHLLKLIAAKGPIPALLNADTSIGRTLEHLLGIDINSSKKPDFNGVEIKAFRKDRGNRKNLFAQVPNWNFSKFKSSAEILMNFGYSRGDVQKLYCTVSSISTNSQGLKLRLDQKLNLLIETSFKPPIGDFIVWDLTTLHNRLLEKHSETFWVSAKTMLFDGHEYFQFEAVEHTKKPILSQFDILIDQGIITVDHLIKKTLDGKVVEKGPLFKIRPSATNLLFPPSNKYQLV